MSPRRSVPVILSLVALLAGLPHASTAPAFQRPASGSAGGVASPRPPRIAIFGIDAADWIVIDALVARNQLPTFARLEKVASLGTLKADPPLLSPMIWTTIATGRDPTDHGVLDFMEDAPGGGQVPISSRSRRANAIWEIWSQAGRTVLVTGWWATWPADRVRGTLVSDLVASQAGTAGSMAPHGLVFPPQRWTEVSSAIVSPASIDFDALNRLFPVSRREFEHSSAALASPVSSRYRDPIAYARDAIAATRTYRAISTRLAERDRPDLWATYYEVVDIFSHLFVADRSRGEMAIAAAYAEVDAALADAARVLDPDTCLIVVSDHGFYSPDAGIRDDPSDLTSGATAWHRPLGIVAVTTAGALLSSASAAPHSSLGTISPLDILPSLLVRAELPVARDMPGRVVPAIAGNRAERVGRISSYGGHDLADRTDVPAGPGSSAQIERLRALGYLAGGAPTSLGRVNLAEFLYRKGDLAGARTELEAVVRRDPANTRATTWLARVYADLHRPDDALRLYDRLISANSSTGAGLDPLVFLAATDVALARHQVTDATARLARVPSALRRAPEVLVAGAEVSEVQGNPREAERGYRLALEAAPAYAEALERLLDLLLHEGRTEAAATLSERAADQFRSSPMHLALAGEVDTARHRYKEAERRFDAALVLSPDSVSVRVALARVRVLDRRPDAALDALDHVTGSRDADILRGAIYSEKRDWPSAASAYTRAVEAGDPTRDLLTALGQAQLRAGRPAEAVKTLERSLSLDGTQQRARELLEEARRSAGSRGR